MNFWESEEYFSILKSRLNYLVTNQSQVSLFKIQMIKSIRIYQIFRALRKVFRLEIYTDLCYLVNRSVPTLENIKILDIGGGIGENYFELMPIQLKNSIHYVHDSYMLFARGEKFRSDNVREYDAIIFAENIDSFKLQFDLLLLNGSIQYLKDMVATINQLRVKPKHIVLDRALLSNNSLTVKQVNKGGYITEYKVYSENDLISKFALLGYELKRSGSKRTHKILFDENYVSGYYKAKHFVIKPIDNSSL